MVWLGFEPGAAGDEGRKVQLIPLGYSMAPVQFKFHLYSCRQCDQKKIAKCLWKLPKNGFTLKMTDFDNFTKNA